MNTKYEIRLVAKNNKGREVTVETMSFNNESLVKYHVKTLDNYIKTSKYFNDNYTDAKIKVVENEDWKPAPSTGFEWSKEDGKYIKYDR